MKRPEPRPYPQSKYSPWMVYVGTRFTGQKPQRFFFKSREAAQYYCDNLSVRNYSTLNPHPSGQSSGSGRLLSDCAKEWINRSKEQKPTFFQVRQIMTPLIARFGQYPIDVVGVPELDGWFRSLALKYSPETMHNYWRRTRHFFQHCHNFGFVTKNPFAVLKEPARRDRRNRHILHPKQMAKLLEAAKDDRALTAYLCLGGFAGIRTSEILKMDWDDLLWDDDEICVRHAKEVNTSEAKETWVTEDDEEEQDISGDRLVTIEAAFRRHVEPIALKGKAIDRVAERRPDGGRGSRKIVPGGQRTLYGLRSKLREVLGVKEWPDNCLRHSYKSHHVAAFRNLELTRVEMGHSDSDTTKYKYASPGRKKVAEQWWAL